MQAVVDIAGKQVKVAPSDKLFVPKLKEAEGTKITFEKVLLLQDEKSLKIGTPYVKGASVEAKVLGEERGKKVIIFKKKRRKGFRVKRGHRQRYTQIEITNIAG
jgi:large subunit ribosomal protein L21